MRQTTRAVLVVLAVSLLVAVVVGAAALLVLELAFRPALTSPWSPDAVPRDQVRRVFAVPPPSAQRRYLSRQFTTGGRVLVGLVELGSSHDTTAALLEAGLHPSSGDGPDVSAAAEALAGLGLTVSEVTPLAGFTADVFHREGALLRAGNSTWLYIEAAEAGEAP